MQSWWHLLEWRSAERPDQTAVVVDGRPTTFGELKASAERRAGAWSSMGVGPGDVVALMARNSTEYLVQIFALQRVGAIPALVNWRLLDDEVCQLLDTFGATAVAADDEFAPLLERLDNLPETRVVLDHPRGGWSFAPDRSGELPARPLAHLRRNEPFAILHTSGTTGHPKAIPVTNGPHIDGCFGAAMTCPGMGPAARHLRVMPLFHLSGLSGALLSLLTGGVLFLERDFSADRYLDLIEQERIEFTNGGPTVLRVVLDEIERRESAPDLSSLVEVWYGNSPITSELLARVLDVFRCRFRQNYGMTEAQSPVSVLAPADHAVGGEKLHTAGRPAAGWEIRIVDDREREVSAGTPGEILLRSENMFPGYWNNPDATAAAFTGECDAPNAVRWYRTGDVGSLDADGYLTILDRKKDMVISGGENVYPAEVENVVSAHPAVHQVAVIGTPHEKWGETVTAVVVPANGATPDADDIIGFTRDRLAHFKCPTRVEFIDELPRNATGKVLKREVRARFVPTH